MTEDPILYGASAFDRLYTEFNAPPKKALAKKLHTTVQKLSAAETTGAIPAEWLLTLLRKEGINPEWIITGKGAKRLVPLFDYNEGSTQSNALNNGSIHDNSLNSMHKDAFFQIRFRPPRECSTDELLKELFRRTMTNFSSY